MYKGVRWHERNGKWEARIFDSAAQKQVPPAYPCPAYRFTQCFPSALSVPCPSCLQGAVPHPNNQNHRIEGRAAVTCAVCAPGLPGGPVCRMHAQV